jgi:hypothetical protein
MIWKAIAITAIWFAPWLPFIIMALNKAGEFQVDVKYQNIGLLQLLATIAVVIV